MFLFGPGRNTLADQANIELALVVIGGGFDQAACFIAPTRVPGTKRNVGEQLDADDSFRIFVGEN
jgi:hypothetical protein